MTFKKNIFFCLECKEGIFSSEDASHHSKHGCSVPLKLIQATVTFDIKRSRFQRFIDWLLKDIQYWLAFTSAVIINAILLPHFNLSFKESFLESFCLGIVLIRLLKQKTII